jgi:hypothetical protein
MAAVLCAVPVLASYSGVLTATSNSSLGVRTVEWLRDNGARGLVAKVESWYYAAIAPSTGGPALRTLPHQPGVAARATFSPSPSSTGGVADQANLRCWDSV